MDKDLCALVLLNMVSGIGSVRAKKLFDYFNHPSKIFECRAQEILASGILNSRMVDRLLAAPRSFDVDREFALARELGVRILTLLDQDYPQSLRTIVDPPLVLYVKGEILESDELAVAVVGSRGASYYGLSCAKDFSGQLARCGLTIVSGLARGIDTAAHRAALDEKGRTIAVLGSGLDRIYPPENAQLALQIPEHGAVVSEFPFGRPPLAQNFPGRNRIISALSKGVLIVEATQRSGALITARYALEQGREIFAIPGKVGSQTSVGTNDLIRQGAQMVTSADQILLDLAPHLRHDLNRILSATAQTSGSCEAFSTELERLLDDEPKAIDEILNETTLSAQEALSLLLQLELEGRVDQLPGKRFIRARESFLGNNQESHFIRRGENE